MVEGWPLRIKTLSNGSNGTKKSCMKLARETVALLRVYGPSMFSAPHNAAENVQRVSKDLRARPPNCQIKVQILQRDNGD